MPCQDHEGKVAFYSGISDTRSGSRVLSLAERNLDALFGTTRGSLLAIALIATSNASIGSPVAEPTGFRSRDYFDARSRWKKRMNERELSIKLYAKHSRKCHGFPLDPKAAIDRDECIIVRVFARAWTHNGAGA